jgi:hypothetical protein
MKQKIIENIDNPEALEKLYRENKQDFSAYFSDVAAEHNTDLVHFWQIRLQNSPDKPGLRFDRTDFLVAAGIALITAILSRLPGILPALDDEFFYSRNIAAIVFSSLILFTLWQNRIFEIKKVFLVFVPVFVLVLYLNLLPSGESDSKILAFIHAVLYLWCIFGIAYVNLEISNKEKLFRFIRYNGELITLTGLLLIAGAVLTGMTIGLFEIIGMSIDKIYTENVVVMGASASLVIAAWLIGVYPSVTSRISTIIARIFTPLVLVSAVVYLVAIFVSGVRFKENRELLVMFNLLLVAVMAIVVFSVSELDKSKARNLNVLMLFLLAIVTIVINIIALIAIISRLTDGFTPNRTAVLISNLIVFIHLLLITPGLFSAWFRHASLDAVEKKVAGDLPVYFIYTVIVIFLFPLLFGMK